MSPRCDGGLHHDGLASHGSVNASVPESAFLDQAGGVAARIAVEYRGAGLVDGPVNTAMIDPLLEDSGEPLCGAIGVGVADQPITPGSCPGVMSWKEVRFGDGSAERFGVSMLDDVE